MMRSKNDSSRGASKRQSPPMVNYEAACPLSIWTSPACATSLLPGDPRLLCSLTIEIRRNDRLSAAQ